MTTSYDGLFADDIDKHLMAVLHKARRSCINCAAFELASEGCGKAGGQRPPAMIIARGCPVWEGGPPF